ncbi:unnamed protein product [Paramecium sonneborni]|uniref:Uncharacterized protein n=1 Tax=Paramecium sonneborni TaxID=65129 RepID=A0A8S1QZE6_9CILI|nr:unnamed protein product [Paramecium sonneborni]
MNSYKMSRKQRGITILQIRNVQEQKQLNGLQSILEIRIIILIG